MKALTVLLLASLLSNVFLSEYSFASGLKNYSMPQDSTIVIPADSIIDIDLLLNDTTLFEEVNDTDTLKSDSLVNTKIDSVMVKKLDSIKVKPVVPKKPEEVIPQSVIELNKMFSDYREYTEWAQDRWDDIYLSLSEIKMKADYFKFVVPLTYYSKAFEEASGIDDWIPRDIIVDDSLRKASMLEEGMPKMPSAIVSFDLDTSGFGLFMNGFGELFSHPDCVVALFSLLFVDFFDTAGTLISVANKTNLVDQNGELENIEQALVADSVGTVIGGILGTSTVTSFVESTAGVEAGGRTGLTACVTAVLFLLSIFFAPVLSVVTSAVTAPALVAVGISMASQLGGIDWDDIIYASSGFITVIIMVLTYSISDGIAFGFIVYGLTSVVAGKGKDIKPIVWILILVFVLYFAFI